MLGQRAMETATRLGFAARALMYVLLGWIALRTGRSEGNAEVLEYLQGGAGQVVLAVMAIGFFAYGLWRLIEAAVDSEGHGGDAKGVAVRIGGAVSGLVHFALGVYAMRLATSDTGSGGGTAAEEGAATALSLPGGTVLLMVAAASLIATAGYQFVKSAKGTFLKHLQVEAARRSWVKWAGRAGYAARGVVFLIMGWFLWRAAQDHNAGRAGDVGSALEALSGPLQAAVAVGLLLFGIFSAVEAVYRRINNPEVISRLQSRVRAPGTAR